MTRFRSSYNKYSNHRFNDSKGQSWDSKLEYDYYHSLYMLERAKKIRNLTRQVRIKLGKSTECKGHYVADFVYYDIDKGIWIVCDVKGFETDVFKLKLKWVLDMYSNFDFQIVKGKNNIITHIPFSTDGIDFSEYMSSKYGYN